MASNKLKLREYYEFVKWTATPRGYRSPATQGEFSAMWGLHPGTLSEWKADPHFTEDVRRQLYDWTGDLTPDVVGAIFLTATKGDPKAQALWLKYFGNLPNPDKPTPGELHAQGETLADALLARLKERQARNSPVHHDTRQNSIANGGE